MKPSKSVVRTFFGLNVLAFGFLALFQPFFGTFFDWCRFSLFLLRIYRAIVDDTARILALCARAHDEHREKQGHRGALEAAARLVRGFAATAGDRRAAGRRALRQPFALLFLALHFGSAF